MTVAQRLDAALANIDSKILEDNLSNDVLHYLIELRSYVQQAKGVTSGGGGGEVSGSVSISESALPTGAATESTLAIIAEASILTPTIAVVSLSNHLSLSTTTATPLSQTQLLCESVALFPQKENGAVNAASIFFGFTAARQRIQVYPGYTIGPFTGRKLNLQDVYILGEVDDGIEFLVVQ
jgi:hypothetical protein